MEILLHLLLLGIVVHFTILGVIENHTPSYIFNPIWDLKHSLGCSSSWCTQDYAFEFVRCCDLPVGV